MGIQIVDKTMDRLNSMFVHARDTSSVTYNRFGQPEDNADDAAPPTSIIVASFDETSPEFMVFKRYHAQKAAVTSVAVGMSFVILMFISSFFEFDWYHHAKGIDFAALLGLFAYLIGGVLLHYYVIYGCKKQSTLYLMPFIIIYTLFLIFECCTFFTFFISILLIPTSQQQTFVDPTSAHSEFMSPAYKHSMIIYVIVMAPIILVQATMLYSVVLCRNYISCKNTYEISLKVAEKAKQRYPEMVVIIGNAPMTSVHVPPSSPRIVEENKTVTSFDPADIERQVQETNENK
uniref:MARVEL domain-containing protein n=1 Tax=Rhabditophanes sp. KR3021 TaxID=114890 RepID=A0AC35TUJ1_9BILA